MFDDRFEIAFWAMCAVIILAVGMIFGYKIVKISGNHTESELSQFFGGYSDVKVYEIYDRDTGVYYAVTEDGGMTPLYNPDGTLKTVDGIIVGQDV